MHWGSVKQEREGCTSRQSDLEITSNWRQLNSWPPWKGTVPELKTACRHFPIWWKMSLSFGVNSAASLLQVRRDDMLQRQADLCESTWSTQWATGQPRLHREPLAQNTIKKKKKERNSLCRSCQPGKTSLTAVDIKKSNRTFHTSPRKPHFCIKLGSPSLPLAI